MRANFTWLFPDLQRLPPGERGDALRRAARCPLDTVELLGIAGGLVAVTALTRYGAVELSLAQRLGMVAANFVVAVPLLAVAIAPFHFRRVRRGLREILRLRGLT
jgi:hypothetical protein